MNFLQINIFVDAVIVSLIDNKVHVLLGKRNTDPVKDQYALIGGHHKGQMNSINSLKYHLENKINLKARNIQKFDWLDEPLQDTRGPSVALAHLVLISENDRQMIKLNEAFFSELKWCPVDELHLVQFGFIHHKQLIDSALKKLENNVRYEKTGFELLNEEFSINDVVNSFSVIVGAKIDPSNLTKKLKKLNIIEETNSRDKKKGKGKKATIYKLNRKAFDELPLTTTFFKKVNK